MGILGRKHVGVTMRTGTRIALGVTICAVAAGGPLEAQMWGSATSRSCDRGGEPRPSLGIGTFHCRGGTCLVGGIYATQAGLPEATRGLLDHHPRAWDFSVEPSLWEIAPDGPAAGRVLEGDVLLAVDGSPVTTREAGRTLAALEPGTPVELTLRRDGDLVQVEIVPVEGCASFTVSTGPGEMPRFLERDARGRVGRVRRDRVDRSLSPVPTGTGTARFEAAGLVLAGATEIRVAPDGSVSWWFVADPVVAEVVEGGEAGRLGIVPGEVIVTADDQPLTEPAGVSALAGAAPDRPVMLFVRRGRSFRQVEIHEH